MAMGRDSEVQSDLIVTWAEIPRSPGHVFYDKLQKLADGHVDMVIPGHDAEVMRRFPASKPGLEGISVRLD